MTGVPQGFEYIPEFLSQTEQAALLQNLRPLPYAHDVFMWQRLKRGYAQFGYAYVSAGRKINPAPPIPDFLYRVIEKASSYYPTNLAFTQCIVTQYPPGAGIGWHTDAPQFGEYILAVSLAAVARLQFRPTSTKVVSYEVTVSPGSVYVLQGLARWHYQHRVVPVKAERYSVTFRSIAQSEQASLISHR